MRSKITLFVYYLIPPSSPSYTNRVSNSADAAPGAVTDSGMEHARPGSAPSAREHAVERFAAENELHALVAKRGYRRSAAVHVGQRDVVYES